MASSLPWRGGEERISVRRSVLLRRQASISSSAVEAPCARGGSGLVGGGLGVGGWLGRANLVFLFLCSAGHCDGLGCFGLVLLIVWRGARGPTKRGAEAS